MKLSCCFCKLNVSDRAKSIVVTAVMNGFI